MPSIVDKITAAEEQALCIKRDAAQAAREAVAEAGGLANASVAQARDKARGDLVSAQARSEQEGAALADAIRAQHKAEADALCRAALSRMAQAVDHILKKVVESC